MNKISVEQQEMSIKSLESTFNKLSNAYKSMTEKGSNTTLVKKRKDAVLIGIASLKEQWYGEDFTYDDEIIATSEDTLKSIVPSIKTQIIKAKKGSPQITLNERRLRAFKLAIVSLNNRLS